MKWFLIFTTLAVLAAAHPSDMGETSDWGGVRDPGGNSAAVQRPLPWHGPRGVYDPRIDGTVLR